MNTNLSRAGLAALVVFSIPTMLQAQNDAQEPAQSPQPAQSLGQALKQGTTTVQLRYRFETVDQDGFNKEAHASTLRTALAYASQPFKGWSVELEAENVATVGNDLYNNRGAGSDSNGVTDRPVVADPELTQLNQAFIRYERGETEFTVGRREILLGDVRYVGNVGWRQHHQSFDAVTLTNSSLDHLTVHYSYLDKVHRIFGDSQLMASHLLNLGIAVGDLGKITAYGYLLDYDQPQDAIRSTSTFGVELAGQRQLCGDQARCGPGQLLYELEWATQSDAGDNPRQIDADYLHAVIGGKARGMTVKLGLEVLDGNRSDGQFNTPLATLHAWNGWADKFLVTPPDGLEDLYLSLAGNLPFGGARKLAWKAIYHDFGAATGGASYGDEIDLQLTCKATWGQVFGLKAALYNADTFSSDVDKLMFWSAYRF